MAATHNRQFKNICVLSGFNYGKHKEFVEPAIDLGRSIAERKFHLVYEGGNRGLSKRPSVHSLETHRPESDPWTFVLERPNNDGNSSRIKKYKLDLTLCL
ncbi:hypothetical protein WN943_026891 [Citrus x changshan-huyou]